jgi:predicted SnoaL-like aldol condensation-catalyzing enzyme
LVFEPNLIEKPSYLSVLIYIINSLSTIENENENLVRRLHMDIFQQGNLEVVDEILSDSFKGHNPVLPPEIKNGSDGVKKFASATMNAFLNRQFVHKDTIVKGDKVMIR